MCLKNHGFCVTLQHEHTVLMEGHIMAERNLENITVTMTKEEKKALKQAALDNDCSVSELIRRWLEEYRAKEAEKRG